MPPNQRVYKVRIQRDHQEFAWIQVTAPNKKMAKDKALESVFHEEVTPEWGEMYENGLTVVDIESVSPQDAKRLYRDDPAWKEALLVLAHAFLRVSDCPHCGHPIILDDPSTEEPYCAECDTYLKNKGR